VLCIFYELAILFAKWNDRRRQKADEFAEFADLADTEASSAPIASAVEAAQPVTLPDALEPPELADSTRASVSSGAEADDIT
jgi:hypothetical protein